MKKRILSMVLCFCMTMSLLPMSALAAEYDGWEAATSDGVTLTADTDTVTIDGVTYTYKGDASTSGIQMYSGDEISFDALTEAYCWKAGSGYVLYNPTVESGKTISAEVTLHNATISTEDATALNLPITGNMEDGSFPVPVTVYVEGANSLATSDAAKYALYNGGGNNTLITSTGGGTLSLTNSASSGVYSSIGGTVVTMNSGTQVTVSGGSENTIQKLAVTGSDSKLTIVSGTKLNVINTCTVDEGAILENNGTLNMMYKTKEDPGITGELSGGGGIVFSSESETVYCLVNGEFIPYGGDVSESGLDLSASMPAIATRYKAGNGYISYTPATAGPAANAKLELHDAVICTTSGRALFLPAGPVDITVTGINSLTANGSYNYAIDPNGQAVSITGDGNLTLNGNRGIVPWDGTTPSITINIGGALNMKTTGNPIEKVSGNLQIAAKSITIGDTYGVFCDGMASFEATDGDITLTGGSDMAAVNGAGGVFLKASGKITVDNSAGSNALSSEYSTVTVDAQGDVAIKAGNSNAIWFDTDVAIRSNAGSVDVTTGGYTCIEKKNGGASGGGVEVRAAKDITLNADTTAIQTSAEDVNLTAGDKLYSTSAYGFQVRALTIKANEVSIEGKEQDGIRASSVSITNPSGGNCKSVSVTATSNSDSWAAISSGDVTVKADDLYICGNGSAKAISSSGTVTLGDAGLIVGAIAAGTKSIAAGVTCANVSGGDASGGLNLTAPPSVATYYTAGSGYALFTPATTTPAAPAKLTLHNAIIHNTTPTNDETGTGIALPDGAITIELEAVNMISAQNANAIWGTNTDVTLSGSGVLNVGYSGISLKSTAANPHALTKGANVTLNGIVKTYDNLSENSDSNANTVYGSVDVPADSHCTLAGTITVAGGAILTIPQGTTLNLKDAKAITNNGTLANNGTLQLPQSYNTEAAIKALKLTGSGMVKAAAAVDTNGNVTAWDSYTNDGAAIKVISSNLDLTTGGDSGDLTADGYHWDDINNTLTLGDVFVSGSLTLPDNTIIKTTSGSTISGGINGAGGTAMHLIFEGTAPLNINGIISLGSNGDSVTVQEGAHVTLNGSLSLGVYDGTLNVIGSGTTLSICSDNSYAALCGEVNVGSGASLTAKAAGSDSVGLKVEKINGASGNVSVSGGSTLTVGCDYGVYVKDGSFTIDESSTFTANADVAAVCVVDTTKMKTERQTLNVPSSMLPSGTKITDAVGNTVGCGYHYFSIANNASTLAATNESSNPATLTGALGAITLKKASSGGNNNNNGGGSGGGGSASSYTLTFETNGGTAISSVSKTSGTVVDLSGYKATRDGYDFAGWYSDTALTTKVTSVTLTKSATVYAKWTEKTVQSANPFVDVADSAYYHDAVLWATEKGITSGTTGTTFSPDKICTRAQAVTFLWRAEGSPEPASANCPFTDVSAKDYYYKAVLWAVEKGIVKGTSPTIFSPSATVTRSQSMTFLWRAAGETTSISANPFADVSKDAYYYNAVLWAVEKDITKGTSDTAFSPDGGCTRAQIVTFLYRYMGK